MLGGLIVGGLAVWVPQVCGNGYSVVLAILNGGLAWKVLVLVLCANGSTTAASFRFWRTWWRVHPDALRGGGAGLPLRLRSARVWPAGAADPRAFALVGMGALLAAASHAPVMAIILLFEMTLSYDIIVPLDAVQRDRVLQAARGIEDQSLYSEALRQEGGRGAGAFPAARRGGGLGARPDLGGGSHRPFRRYCQPVPRVPAGGDIRRQRRPLCRRHFPADIKPYLSDEVVAEHVIAEDVRREDVPTVAPSATLADALRVFAQYEGQTLPVVEPRAGTWREFW
jgi:CIC family chloride channel protein